MVHLGISHLTMVNNSHKAKTPFFEMGVLPADNRVRAVGCGAIEAIVGAMKVHAGNPNTCYNGCVAIGEIVKSGKQHMQNLRRFGF